MEAARVEKARQALEDKISKLRNALVQWRTREAEYEAFKEELSSLNPDATVEEIIGFGTNFGGDVINEDEIKDLLGYGRATAHRTKSQVQDNLSKRVDVARENADTLQKQIDRAEAELEQPLDAAADTGDGQPVMEIYEELDDVGNVLSSRLIRAETASETFGALFHDTVGARRSGNVQIQDGISPSSKETQDVVSTENSPAEAPNSTNGFSEAKSHSAFLGATGPILELDENDNVIRSISPTSEDIATHRAEVFENASTLGPVVATMDIEEGSDFSDDENYDEDDFSEDEHRFVIGRSRKELEGTEWEMDDIRENLTPEYIAEMEALVKKYNQPVMGNLGPQDVGFPLGKSLNEPVPKTSSPPQSHLPRQENEHDSKKSATPKGVRFAEELDILSESALEAEKVVEQPTLPIRPKQATISDVVERAPAPILSNPIEPDGKKRNSRFKSARHGT
jgi:unconventional prefoldin RPB5 interactor 1